MQKLTLISLIVSFSLFKGSIAQNLPEISCTGISNTSHTFPFVDEAGTKVIFVIFNIKAEKEIDGWVNPLYQKFIQKSGLLDAMIDADFKTLTFLNPIQYSELKASGNKIDSQVPKELTELSYYSKEQKSVIQQLLDSKSDTSVLVISETGNLLGFVCGEFTEDKLEQIEELIP